MMADVPEPGSEHRVTASVARFCPLLLNDLRHPRIPAQMPWSTFAGSLGRPRDALAQARRRPGQSPIRINGSP
jgi:hypothetical protein